MRCNKFNPNGVIDLEDIKMRADLLKKRLEPILDVLVIANMKIERYDNSNQSVPQDLIVTRDKM